MRRTFNNSTAIAVALAMVLPQAVAAQSKIIPASQAAETAATREQNMPDLAQALKAEMTAGLTADDLQCPMNAPKPCTTDYVFTPEGIAVQLADDGLIFLAAASKQTSKADADGNVTVDPAAPVMQDTPKADKGSADAVEQKLAQNDAATAAEKKPKKKADKAAKKPAKEAAKADDAAMPAPDKSADATDASPAPDATKPAAEAIKPAPKAAKPAAAAKEQAVEADAKAAPDAVAADAKADAKAKADTKTDAKNDADALAKKLADKEKAASEPAVDTAGAKATDKPDTADKAAKPKPKGQKADGTAATPPAADADAKPPKKAKPAADAATQPKADKTEADAAATPDAGDKTSADALAKALGDKDKPAQPETSEQTPPPVAVPEAKAKQTDAAKQAAAETTAPTADALADSGNADTPVVETKVTKENARSSDEDFATKVSDAMKAAAAATADKPKADADVKDAAKDNESKSEAKKSDGSNDLAKIALGALAGYAAGQILSNNRKVALNTGDRVVVTLPDGSQQVVKDDNALLMQPGSTVQTQNFADGSSRTTVVRQDGSQVVTIRDADLRVLRRTLISADGTATQLIDDTEQVQPVKIADLPAPAQPVSIDPTRQLSESELRAALEREVGVDRSFTLGQVRNIPEVRALVAPVDIQAITFDTGSAAIKPDQAQKLSTLGRAITDMVRASPREIFMVEGYTDTVGSDATNLALSDRRAESVALALTEYFDVPPENMVVQGYGEQFLRVQVEGDVRANRRASVRRITDLLAQK